MDRLPARLRRGRAGARRRWCSAARSSDVLRRARRRRSSCWPAPPAWSPTRSTRPAQAPANPTRLRARRREFFQDFSPSFRTSIADAYYLDDGPVLRRARERRRAARLAAGDGRPGHDAQPALHAAYLFGAFALVDAGPARRRRTQLLKKGFKANPDDWQFPAYLGVLRVPVRRRARTRTSWPRDWYRRRPRSPAARTTSPRLAAALLGKGGETREGDPHVGPGLRWPATSTSRQKAVDGLDRILPEGEGGAHEGARAALRDHAEGGLRGAHRRALQGLRAARLRWP